MARRITPKPAPPWPIIQVPAMQASGVLLSIAFYDQGGFAIAYCDDGVHVFLFAGEPIGYLEADALYTYRGELMGWFEEGWLRDKDGRCVAFSERAVGGPQRAEKKAWPAQLMKQRIPTVERRDPRGLRPIHSNAWSALSMLQFFAREPRGWPGGPGNSPV